MPLYHHQKKLFAVLGSLLIVSGIFFLLKTNQKKQTQWVDLKKGPIVQAVYGLGTLTPERQIDLKPGMAGTIDRIFVTEGQRVSKGASLVQLSGSPVFTSPFEGEITSLPFQVGENVFPQIPILTLMDLKKMYVQMTVEQSSAIWIRPGQETVLSFESLPHQSFLGKVRSITPKSGQFSVRVDLDSLPDGVLPGMTADCAITVGKKMDAILVPLKAIDRGKIRIQDSQGQESQVSAEVGVIDGEWAEWKNPNPQAIKVYTRGVSE